MANASGDSKKLYKVVSELTGSIDDNPLPSGESDTFLADHFADHFMDKISKIRDSLKGFKQFEPQEREGSLGMNTFKDLTEDEIRKLISEMNTTSSELDILPTKVLKMYLHELLSSITSLVNLSLREGVFPSKWKQAIVKPLLKKAGLELIVSNYRPVSNLSFLSKLIEKAVLCRVNQYVNEYNLMPENQSAYRRFHSCESYL